MKSEFEDRGNREAELLCQLREYLNGIRQNPSKQNKTRIEDQLRNLLEELLPCYRERIRRFVVGLLNSEDAERSLNGLTGARSIDEDRDLVDPYYNENQGLNDRELRRLISALMSR